MNNKNINSSLLYGIYDLINIENMNISQLEYKNLLTAAKE